MARVMSEEILAAPAITIRVRLGVIFGEMVNIDRLIHPIVVRKD